ncbi:MAG TPA: electron transfer flavoprotein subunit alpha/FixB family protein [Anaerolineales bacterium]|nr:electron transfer flavoprotein subunit alpha/FixB family protein [Anaerolineales bacterium]
MNLVLIEHDQGKLSKTAMEVLIPARDLAKKTNTRFAAVLIGDNALSVVDTLQYYGVKKVYHVKHGRLDDYAPDAWAESVVQLIQKANPQTVLAVGSDRGNEVMARVAAKTNNPMAANCIAIEPGEKYRVTRVRWGGSLFEEAWLDGIPKLLTVATLTFESAEIPGSEKPETEEFVPELSDKDFRVRVTRRIPPEGGVSLSDARVVVGGGRGVGSKEGFALLEELAELLGGTVGGSRVVTNLGWRSHADQIGQTGTRISPDLYIACGISGAIQHWVGCMGSKTILAINSDPEAPIVTKADYAVIGDLHEVIPALCAEIKKMK